MYSCTLFSCCVVSVIPYKYCQPTAYMWYQHIKHTTDKISFITLQACKSFSVAGAIMAEKSLDYIMSLQQVTNNYILPWFYIWQWLLHKLCWSFHIGSGPSLQFCWLSASEGLDSSAGYRPPTNDYELDVICSNLLNRGKQNEQSLQIWGFQWKIGMLRSIYT